MHGAGRNPILSDVNDRIALVLGAGGIAGGVYELGVLSALDDFIVRGRSVGEFDVYVGISAGSLPAAFLANGIPVKEMCRSILGQEGHPLLFRREDIYEIRLPALLRAGIRLLGGVVPVIRYLRRERQPVTFLNVLALLQQYLPAGFFSNANLERYVARILSGKGLTNDFRALRKELFIVATELDRSERVVFGRDGASDVPISRAIQASTAIPLFFEPVRIGDSWFIDGAAERADHLDIPLSRGANLVIMVNPTVPVYNDRTVVCIPTLSGSCSSLTELGFTSVAEQTFRINTRVKLELGITLHRQRHPDADILLLEPAPMDSTLFLYGSMNFSERIQALNYGYNSAAYFFMENFENLRTRLAKYGMEVSMEEVHADRFLELATRAKGRRRFALKYSRP
ncbi:MAG: patatin-like phospholipase family protein [Deltaproteobacteria bacterium]|nr:patatin-like phospholipase family protein [Deltaproteobacteria bacterium]